MAVRNFWIEAEIDGRMTTLSGGPQRKDGGFSMSVYIRHEGEIVRAVDLNGYAHYDGKLVLDVFVPSREDDGLERASAPNSVRTIARRDAEPAK